MKIVWFSWKDIKHPEAGGAEIVSYNLMKRLVSDGHDVTLLTAQYSTASTDEIDGIKIRRAGNRFTVYFKTRQIYKKYFLGNTDLVVDEMNTVPFGAAFFAKTRSILFVHQLARKVWFYQMFWPLSWIGYMAEPVYLWVISKKYKRIITISASTRQDLQRYGFLSKNIKIIRLGIELQPLNKLTKKASLSTILFLGALRPMKRTIDAVKAFEYARDSNPDLNMKIAGDSSAPYGQETIRYIAQSRHKEAIDLLGRVDNATRLKLMREAGVIVVTSIKEGWGLIVTEANSQGTPAAAYDIDGLRDSVQDRQTGLLAPSGKPEILGKAINELLSNPKRYEEIRQKAWENSKQHTFENSFDDFKKAINNKLL